MTKLIAVFLLNLNKQSVYIGIKDNNGKEIYEVDVIIVTDQEHFYGIKFWWSILSTAEFAWIKWTKEYKERTLEIIANKGVHTSKEFFYQNEHQDQGLGAPGGWK